MPRLGLRVKFFLYSNSLIAVTMALVTFLGVRHEEAVQYEAIQRRARSVTEALSIPITDALMYQELGVVSETGLIDNIITEMLERNRDLLRYVVVVDPSGKTSHSSRWEELGRPFPRALSREAIGRSAAVERRITSWGEPVVEIRTTLNVSTRFWGTLAVGFSLQPIGLELQAMAARLILVALALMLGNSVMTAIYVETLIRPILGLHGTMQRAAEGASGLRAEGKGRDEVGDLARAFNGMMEELERGREREQARLAQLAHTEKMAAIGSLATGVAHEVNNPLAGILTCLEMVRANPNDANMRSRYLELVEDGIKRIGRTVTSLLDFSRPRPMELEETPANDRLRHVVELVDYQLRSGRVEAVFDLDPAEPVVVADRFQLEQVLLNLVLNAIQAMRSGGTLTLRSRAAGDQVELEVEDTGEGIPEGNRKRIFDPFFTTRSIGQGTGLGLSVTDSIVTAHGGRIEVESRPGVGSTFRVVLPSREAPRGGVERG
jgi:two-component system, NtrC family, sensor kinase